MKFQAMNTKTVSFFAIVAFMLPLALFVHISTQAFAQIPRAEVFPKNVITLDSVRDYESLPQSEYFLDVGGKMTFENVLLAAQKGAFAPVGTKLLRVGGMDALWMRLTVRNTKLTECRIKSCIYAK
jgi:hypothetical protein